MRIGILKLCGIASIVLGMVFIVGSLEQQAQQKKIVYKTTTIAVDDDAALLQVTQANMERLHVHSCTLEDHFNNNPTPVMEDTQQRSCVMRLLTMHKKMVGSYMRDIQDYRKLGIPKDHLMVRFSYQQLGRLALAYADLEYYMNRLRQGVSIHESDVVALRRLMASNQKLINQYLVQRTKAEIETAHNMAVQPVQCSLNKKQSALVSALGKLMK